LFYILVYKKNTNFPLKNNTNGAFWTLTVPSKL